MTSFFESLENRAREIGSLLCIGLDPHPADLAEPTAEAARSACLRLIEATADLALAYKPNAAFFEAFGPEGWAALQDLIAAVPAGIPVILDAKRGDIASTAEAYARSAFERLGADAITLSPYLGEDSLQPFLQNPAKGVFLLCKTSNPGAADLQDLPLAGSGRMLYEEVARRAQGWNRAGNLGLVVGATQLEALARARAAAPDLWFLAPGVGPQGGDLGAALRAGLRPDGLGMVIPVSRGVARAADPRAAALELRRQIEEVREELRKNPPQPPLPRGVTNLFTPLSPPAWARSAKGGRGDSLPVAPVGATGSPSGARSVRSPLRQNGTDAGVSTSLASGLLAAGCVRFGSFTLKSGLQSPIYVDLRNLASHPGLLAEVARAYLPLLQELEFDRLAALPYAALPIGTAVSLLCGWPMIYPRKEAKAYGTKAEIEGEYRPGETAVVVDDLATTGGSKLEALEKLSAAGLKVRDVVVLIDRQSGAAEALRSAGIRLHAVCTLSGLLDAWERSEQVPPGQIEAARKFLAEHG